MSLKRKAGEAALSVLLEDDEVIVVDKPAGTIFFDGEAQDKFAWCLILTF